MHTFVVNTYKKKSTINNKDYNHIHKLSQFFFFDNMVSEALSRLIPWERVAPPSPTHLVITSPMALGWTQRDPMS